MTDLMHHIKIAGSRGILDNENGTYTVTMADLSQRDVTDDEIKAGKREGLKVEIRSRVAKEIAIIYGEEEHSLDLAFSELNVAATAVVLQEIEIAKMRGTMLCLIKKSNGVPLSATEETQLSDYVAGVFTVAEAAIKAGIQAGFTLLKDIRNHGDMLKTSVESSDPDTFKTDGWPT